MRRIDIAFVCKELHESEVSNVAVFRPRLNATATEPAEKDKVVTRVFFGSVYNVQTQLISTGDGPIIVLELGTWTIQLPFS
jgi:hypothetical protein